MKKIQIFAAIAVASFLSPTVTGQTVSTEFDTSDGFVTGPVNDGTAAAGAFDDVTITEDGFSVTFSGGQQQQFFDGPSYNNGPAAYLFVNTGPGSAVFTGTSGNTITGGANNGDQTGLITFSGLGAETVSFFAADRANGEVSTLDIFDVDGNVLTEDFEIESGSVSDFFFEFTAADLGGAIGSIAFDLAGPAATPNPPYVLAIDTFSATAVTAVPEPTSAAVVLLGGVLLASRRRRR